MRDTDEVAAHARFERERREADARYNDALTALDRAVVAAAQPAPDTLARLHTALIVFLQQITPFVENKDREVAAAAAVRTAAIERALEPVDELRSQMAVVQRAVQMLTRQASVNSLQSSVISPQSSVAESPVPSSQSPLADH